MNKMIFILVLSLIAVSKSNDYLREMARGIYKGYSENDTTINETCFDKDFDEDYALLLKGIEEENYAFMSLKIYKITLELESNCNSVVQIFHNFQNIDPMSLISISSKSTRLMKPLIEIYNSDTKTPYEYGVALGGVLKVVLEQ